MAHFSDDETVAKMEHPNLDVGHPAYSKREMATRRSSARRRYSSCTVRSARSWSVVCNGSEAISSSMASMSVATDASFSFKKSEGACGMANSLPPGGLPGSPRLRLRSGLRQSGGRFAATLYGTAKAVPLSKADRTFHDGPPKRR